MRRGCVDMEEHPSRGTRRRVPGYYPRPDTDRSAVLMIGIPYRIDKYSVDPRIALSMLEKRGSKKLRWLHGPPANAGIGV